MLSDYPNPPHSSSLLRPLLYLFPFRNFPFPGNGEPTKDAHVIIVRHLFTVKREKNYPCANEHTLTHKNSWNLELQMIWAGLKTNESNIHKACQKAFEFLFIFFNTECALQLSRAKRKFLIPCTNSNEVKCRAL